MMMLVFAVCGLLRRRCATSKPSILGIITSSSTRSGLSSAALSSASSPSPATATSYPAERRFTSTNRAMSGSSSTTRIVSGTSMNLSGRSGRFVRRDLGEGACRRRRIRLCENARCSDQDVRARVDGAGGVLDLHPAVDLKIDGGVPHVDLRARCFQTRVHVGVELLEGPPGTDAHQHQVVDLFEVGCGCLERRLEVQRQTGTQTGGTCCRGRPTGIRYPL